jgi:hypothetical protein
MIIENGVGDCRPAKVDKTNKLLVRSVIEDGAFEAVMDGNHYAITSGAITLTGTVSNAMLYFKNNENFPLVIDRVIVNTGDSTGGTIDEFILTSTFNPNGLVSGGGVDVTQVNTNLGSSNSLSITSEKGADGATVDGGSTAGAWRIENPTRHRYIDVRWFLPKGSSVALSYTPPASNTSMVAVCAVNAHLVTF